VYGKDESLVEIITDKVTAELPSPISGKLVRILVAEDETVRVGAPIAEIEEESGTRPVETAATAESATSAQAQSSVVSMPATSNQGSVSSAINGSLSGSATATAEKVSPLARRLAQEYQIDLSTIHGTGESGRVRKEDILAHVASQAQQSSALTSPKPSDVTTESGDQLVAATPARRVIAEHMVRSKATSPHAYNCR